MERLTIQTYVYHSPCGDLLLGSFGEKLCLCDWWEARHRKLMDSRVQHLLKADYVAGESAVLQQAITQLDEYFCRRRKVFDLPLLLAGTDFQVSVWNCLRQIPYGQTIAYAQEAGMLGRPKAVRAVASANGVNPIAIIVPCHRVIGSNGLLTGYAGGLETKRFLLDLEQTL